MVNNATKQKKRPVSKPRTTIVNTPPPVISRVVRAPTTRTKKSSNKKQPFQNVSSDDTDIFGDSKLVIGGTSYSLNDYKWLILVIMLLFVYGMVKIFN